MDTIRHISIGFLLHEKRIKNPIKVVKTIKCLIRQSVSKDFFFIGIVYISLYFKQNEVQSQNFYRRYYNILKSLFVLSSVLLMYLTRVR